MDRLELTSAPKGKKLVFLPSVTRPSTCEARAAVPVKEGEAWLGGGGCHRTSLEGAVGDTGIICSWKKNTLAPVQLLI